MPDTSRLYRGLVRTTVALLPLAARFDQKLGRGHRGRRGVADRMRAWADAHRDPARPLAWFHAPSVGEGLQAKAVIERLRATHPDWQVAYTWFSPSAEVFGRKLAADFADYLPWDTPALVEDALTALAPSVLVFAKLDVWPELASRAAARGIPVGLVAGTVSPVSGRLGWPWRRITWPGYASLAAVGAVAQADAERLAWLGVPIERIRVLGDPRFDSVLDVVEQVSPDEPLLRLGSAGPLLVAGSTWPADEAVVLGAWAEVRRTHPGARLLLVPHEPTATHLAGVDSAAARLGLPRPARLTGAPADAGFTVGDTVGQLARLYGAGTMAFVGGGFGRAGLHSVLEPAAWGLPVVFGPFWQSSREADLLRDAGAAMALPAAANGATARLAAIWRGWLDNETARREAGERARVVVEAGRGAAQRSAELVVGLRR